MPYSVMLCRDVTCMVLSFIAASRTHQLTGQQLLPLLWCCCTATPDSRPHTPCVHLLLLQLKQKDTDYYALLGLQHERWTATESQMKQGEPNTAVCVEQRLSCYFCFDAYAFLRFHKHCNVHVFLCIHKQ